MPRLREADNDLDVRAMALRHEQVLTHAQLKDAGVSSSTVCSRIRLTGPWQRLHPGVVLTHTGTATRRERMLGALAYAGEGAMLTGSSALRAYGLRELPASDDVHLLIPHARRCQSRPGVIVERTRSLPEPRLRRGLPVAPPARAVVDACRTLVTVDGVRALVAEAVQSGVVTVAELADALAHTARQRTAMARQALAEVSAGVRSAAEAKVRGIFERHGVPQPRWNCSLQTLDGQHVATPDGYWEDIAGALQIDSMRWHLSPEAYKRTQRRARALGSYGVPVLPVAPADAFSDELAFVREVLAFRDRNRGRVHPPDLVLRPPKGGSR